MIQIILVRHGRTAWNRAEGQGSRFRGLVDLPLSEEGAAQADRAARRLAMQPVRAVYTSPLQRARHTAERIAQPHGLTVRAVPELSAMDYGDWAGLDDREVARRWPDLYQCWRQDPFRVRVPGGDNLAAVRDRAASALRDLLAGHSDGEAIVVVTHEGVCRALCCAWAGLPNDAYWRFRQNVCNLSLFEAQPTGSPIVLAALNDTCHLQPDLARAGKGGTCVILIRHGQTSWNEGAGEERFRGRTDLELDAVGHAQAGAVAARLQTEPISALYTSPLLRARQTMEPLAAALNLPLEVDQGLLDLDYGIFQGLTRAEAAAAYPDLARAWRTSPGQVRFPGGEALADVQARFLALLDGLAARHPGQAVALLGHQMVNKVAACTLLGLDLDQIGRVRQDPCGIDLFQQVHGVWHTLRLNDTCHLKPALQPDAGLIAPPCR